MQGTQNNSRLLLSNPNEVTDLVLSDLITKLNASGIPFGMPGVVINSSDDLQQNRLQVRVPVIDDIFYFNDKGKKDGKSDSEGNDNLPWCLSPSSRFIETPENGAIVFVIFMNSENPYLGRMWGFPLTDSVTSSNLFTASRLTSEDIGTTAWDNFKKYAGVNFNFSPSNSNRTQPTGKTKTTNYKVGVRGKDKNKLLFDKSKTTLVQNDGESNQSKLELTDKASLTAKNIDLLSTDSQQDQRPMFAKPNYEFQDDLLQLVNNILQLLSSSPSINSLSGSPNIPNPAFTALVVSGQKLKIDLVKLKQPGQGSSQYIKVN